MMLAGFAFPQTSLLMILASVAVGSGVLEFVQGTPPFMRDPDPYDWIAGMIGAGAGFILLLIVRLLIQLSNRIVSKRNTLGS
ncbi:hypothetical protein [Sphingomonas edaphi]|nr:hypothetical protein [Sphingomonas edaphi]